MTVSRRSVTRGLHAQRYAAQARSASSAPRTIAAIAATRRTTTATTTIASATTTATATTAATTWRRLALNVAFGFGQERLAREAHAAIAVDLDDLDLDLIA
jgi:hypothetical protein